MNTQKILTLSPLFLLALASINESSKALTVHNKTGQKITLDLFNEGNPSERVEDTVGPEKNKKIQLPPDMIKLINKDRPLVIDASWYFPGEGSRTCRYEAYSKEARVSVQFLTDEHGHAVQLKCIPE